MKKQPKKKERREKWDGKTLTFKYHRYMLFEILDGNKKIGKRFEKECVRYFIQRNLKLGYIPHEVSTSMEHSTFGTFVVKAMAAYVGKSAQKLYPEVKNFIKEQRSKITYLNPLTLPN